LAFTVVVPVWLLFSPPVPHVIPPFVVVLSLVARAQSTPVPGKPIVVAKEGWVPGVLQSEETILDLTLFVVVIVNIIVAPGVPCINQIPILNLSERWDRSVPVN